MLATAIVALDFVVVDIDVDIDVDIVFVVVGLMPPEKVVEQSLDCSEEGVIQRSGLSLQSSKRWMDNADKAIDRVEQEAMDRIVPSLVAESPETSFASFLSIPEQVHLSSLSIPKLAHPSFCSQYSNVGPKY